MDDVILNAIDGATEKFNAGGLTDTTQQINLIELIKQTDDVNNLIDRLTQISNSYYCTTEARILAISAIGKLDGERALDVISRSIEQGDKHRNGDKNGYGSTFNLMLLTETIKEEWFTSHHANIDSHIRNWAGGKNIDRDLQARAKEVLLDKQQFDVDDSELVIQIAAEEANKNEEEQRTSLAIKKLNTELSPGESVLSRCVGLKTKDISKNDWSKDNSECWKNLGLLKSAGYDVEFRGLTVIERLKIGRLYELKPVDNNKWDLKRVILISMFCAVFYIVVLMLLFGLLAPAPYVIWFGAAVFSMSFFTLWAFDWVVAPLSQSPDRFTSLVYELLRSILVVIPLVSIFFICFIFLPPDLATMLGSRGNVDFITTKNVLSIIGSILIIRPVSSLTHEFLRKLATRRRTQSEAARSFHSKFLTFFSNDEVSKQTKIMVSSACGITVLILNDFIDIKQNEYYDSFILLYGTPVVIALATMYAMIDADTPDKSIAIHSHRLNSIAPAIGFCCVIFCFFSIIYALTQWRNIAPSNLSDMALTRDNDKPVTDCEGIKQPDCKFVLHRAESVALGRTHTFETNHLLNLKIDITSNDGKDILFFYANSNGNRIEHDKLSGGSETVEVKNVLSSLTICLTTYEDRQGCTDQYEENSVASPVTLVSNLLATGISSDAELTITELPDDLEVTEESESPTAPSKRGIPVKWLSIKRFEESKKLDKANLSKQEFNIVVRKGTRLVPGTVLYTLEGSEEQNQQKHFIVMGYGVHGKEKLTSVDREDLRHLNKLQSTENSDNHSQATMSVENIKQWFNVSSASGDANYINYQHPLYYRMMVYNLLDQNSLAAVDKVERERDLVQQATDDNQMPNFVIHTNQEHKAKHYTTSENWKYPQPPTLFQVHHRTPKYLYATRYFGAPPTNLSMTHNDGCVRFPINSKEVHQVMGKAAGADWIKLIERMEKVYVERGGGTATERAGYKLYELSKPPLDCQSKYTPYNVVNTANLSSDLKLGIVLGQVYQFISSGAEHDAIDTTITTKIMQQDGVPSNADLVISVRKIAGEKNATKIDELGAGGIETGLFTYEDNAEYAFCVSDFRFQESCDHLAFEKQSKFKWLTSDMRSIGSSATNVELVHSFP